MELTELVESLIEDKGSVYQAGFTHITKENFPEQLANITRAYNRGMFTYISGIFDPKGDDFRFTFNRFDIEGINGRQLHDLMMLIENADLTTYTVGYVPDTPPEKFVESKLYITDSTAIKGKDCAGQEHELRFIQWARDMGLFNRLYLIADDKTEILNINDNYFNKKIGHAMESSSDVSYQLSYDAYYTGTEYVADPGILTRAWFWLQKGLSERVYKTVGNKSTAE